MAADSKRVLVPIGNGTEEMEAVITIDVLRRAGAEVTVASVEKELTCTCSRGVKLVADKLIGELEEDEFDLIACPGGMPGAEHLRDSKPLEQLVKQQQAEGRMIAAICATPAVFFEAKGLIEGRKATAHPAFSDRLSNREAVHQRVVVDGQLTTSRGPGTSFEFALSLVKQLYGEEKMKEVAGPMVMYDFKPGPSPSNSGAAPVLQSQ
jgi:4-methyl-5(b-hydroxyethyl)-thiazole monophosphate biosynthesis